MAGFIALHPAVPVAIAAVNELLADRYENLRVARDYPRIDPAVFIRIDRVGGIKANLITDAPLMLFECWTARSGPVRAEQLAMDLRAALAAAQSRTFRGAFIRGWDEAGVAPLDDPDKPTMERWEVTGTLSVAVNHQRIKQN